jgi:hypothetical protein
VTRTKLQLQFVVIQGVVRRSSDSRTRPDWTRARACMGEGREVLRPGPFSSFSDRSVNRLDDPLEFLLRDRSCGSRTHLRATLVGKPEGHRATFRPTYFFQAQVADNVTRGDTHNWPKKNNYYLYTECHNRVSKQLTLESLVDGFFPLFA